MVDLLRSLKTRAPTNVTTRKPVTKKKKISGAMRLMAGNITVSHILPSVDCA